MARNDEKKAEEQREKVLAEGRFAASEDGDNAIDVSNEEYIGVDPEYRNHAYDEQAPLASDEEDKVADNAKASAEELSNLNVNRAGHTVGEHRAGTGTKVGDDGKTEDVKGEGPGEPGSSGGDAGGGDTA